MPIKIMNSKNEIQINSQNQLNFQKTIQYILKMVSSRKFISLFLLISLVAFFVYSYFSGGIFSIIFKGNTPTNEKLTLIRDYFHTLGKLAPIVYALIVTVEVIVAPIPGALLYIPGGIIFGGLIGGSASLIGNVLGAGISFQIMKVLGRPSLESHLNMESLKKYDSLINKRGIWIILLLRLNPFTSSDLVSYAAGLSRMPVWKVMLGTFLGIAPLCYIQSYFAEGIFDAFPFLIYPLILVCMLYAIFVFWIVMKARNNKAKGTKLS